MHLKNNKKINTYICALFFKHIMLAILSFAGMTLNARSFLFEGERLYRGEYINSENNRFLFGINELGVLELIDTQPNKNSHAIVPGWDGRILWTAKYRDIARNSKIAYNYSENCFSEFIRKCKFWNEGWDDVKDLIGIEYLTITRNPDARISKEHVLMYGKFDLKNVRFIQLYNKSDKIMWEHSVSTTPDYYGSDNRDVAIFLDNYGRVILFNEDGVLWCTCPYCSCENCGPVGPKSCDHFIYSLYFNDKLLGMPLHPKSDRAKWNRVLTWADNLEGRYPRGLIFYSCDAPVHKFPFFDHFWCQVQHFKSKFSEFIIPERTHWVGTSPEAVYASQRQCSSSMATVCHLDGESVKNAAVMTGCERCEVEYESYKEMIARAKK